MRDVAGGGRLAEACHLIDQANAADPNRQDGRPLALVHGELASQWVERLDEAPSDELRIAARAHHLRRWELARADYPDGRAGYLRWRRDNKQLQADAATEIAHNAGYPQATADRITALLLRKGLGSDAETQTLEDAACLAFIETQFDSMLTKLGHEHMVRVVTRTMQKMSPAAIALASDIPLSAGAAAVLGDASAGAAPLA